MSDKVGYVKEITYDDYQAMLRSAGLQTMQFPGDLDFWLHGFLSEYIARMHEGDPGCDAYSEGMKAARAALQRKVTTP